MRRRLARPFGQSIAPTRLLSLMMALVVVGMLYTRAREPQLWRWLAVVDQDDEPVKRRVDAGAPAAPAEIAPEVVVPGPNDKDPAEQAKFQSYLELIADRSPLRAREMLPYWQLLGWSRTESMADLEARAAIEPAFTLLWEHPERYRGDLIRLRLHVRRVLEYEAPENDAGVKVLYEAWGWSDESKSFPYVVVFSEKPLGLPVGNEVQADVVFVGYFLKVMSYTAYDTTRGAPLFVGRVRLPRGGAPAAQPTAQPLDRIVGVVFFIVVIVGVAGWFLLVRRSPPRPPRNELSPTESELPWEVPQDDAPPPVPGVILDNDDVTAGERAHR